MTRRPHLGSLRGRLLVAALALLATGLLIADVTAYLALSRQLQERSDQALDRAFAQLDRAAAGPEVILASGWTQVLLLPNTSVIAWGPEGRQLISTIPAGVPVDDRGIPTSGFVTRLWTPPAPVTVQTGSNRVEVGSILAAFSTQDDTETLRLLFWVEICAGVLIVLGGVLAGRLLLRRALRPLREISQAADRIEAGADEPFPTGAPGTETHDLATSLDRAFTARARSEAGARRFLADASHELRTPVTAIRAWADLYHQGALPTEEDITEAMTSIGREGARVSALVEQMLTLAKLDAGIREGAAVPDDPVDLTVIAGDCCAAVQPLLDDPDRLHLEDGTARPSSAPALVRGDEAGLRRLIDNLVVNAVRHAGPDADIEVRVGGDDHRVLVVVSDTGAGLSGSDLAQAFDRFWSGRPRADEHIPGTGLGLAIARELARAHGGDVRLTPNDPHGLVATLELPRATAAPATAIDDPVAPRPA